MTRETIIRELKNRGYRAETQDTVKNGVVLEGIRILTHSNITPVIYTEEFIKRAEEEHKTLDDVMSDIIKLYESNKSLNFDVNLLFDRNFIFSHVYIGLQKDSTEDILKRPCGFEGIESYLYLREEDDKGKSYSIKVSKHILENAEVSEIEVWNRAESNTNAETIIESLGKVIANIMEMDFDENMEEKIPMYVISNKCKTKGASAVLNKEVIVEFAKKYNTDKIVVLPSSVHEMILIPYTEKTDIEMCSTLVEEVNNTSVDPTERLTDRAYIITL